MSEGYLVTVYNQKLHSYLLTHTSEIMAKWEVEIRANIEVLSSAEQLALRNSIPDLIIEIADALREKKGEHKPSQDQGKHGALRSKLLEYSLVQVLQEYNFLREAIFEVLDRQFSLSATDRNIILEAMARAMSDAVVGFSEERADMDRTKRLSEESERNVSRTTISRLIAEIDQSRRTANSIRQERDESRVQVLNLESVREMTNVFIATLSHDLRNPIGNLKMAMEILTDELSHSQSNLELIELINRNLDRADAMLHDLLDVQRLKAGHQFHLEVSRCDLTQLAQESLHELSAIHGNRFVLGVSHPIYGYWSGKKIKRVIENLVTNAAKYGDTETPIIVDIAQDSMNTILKVHNSGKPIPLQDQVTIFDAFSRVASVAKNSTIGWGLGLALVRGVAEAHGGKVEVHSTAEAGTTFTVTLPNDSRKS